MTTGIGCTVLIDGVRAQDGSPGDNLDDPVVLDDLTVTWGRDDTMSQPEPDSCTFSVMDAVGDGGGLSGFLTTIRTGSRVDVIARGATTPAPSADTFPNPGFESAVVTWSTTNASAARGTARVWGGVYSLAVKPTNPASPASVLFAPAPFEAPGTNPDAWDAIPTTTAGEVWRATLTSWVPTGATATVRPVLFSGPYVASGTPVGDGYTIAGAAAWATLNVEALVEVDDRWVGLQVTLDPTGPSWDQTPPALTWDAVDPALSWDDVGTLYLDDVQVSSPDVGGERGVLVFAGRITSLTAGWDDTADAPVIDVVANGFTADLENRTVGDEPWPVEDVEARAHRILDRVGLPVDIDIDTSLADTLLSWRDVDAQGAAGLLKEVASSVDGVLWPAVHTSLGAYLRLEDPAMRASLLRLAILDGPPPVILHTNRATNPDAERTVGGVTTRTNQITNPSFETDTAGWSASGTGATAARLTTGGAVGAAFVRLTTGAEGTAAAYNSTAYPVTAGEAFAFSARVRGTPSGASVSMRATWAGGPASTRGVGVVMASATEWQTINYTGIVPAGATSVRVDVYALNPTGVSGAVVDIDGVLAERAVAVVLPYFDGATPAAGDFTYQWAGTANASASQQRAPAVDGVFGYGATGARWSSVTEHAQGARSWGHLPTVSGSRTGFVWTFAPTVIAAGQWVTARLAVKGPAGLALLLSVRTSTGGDRASVNLTCTGDWQDVTVTAQAATAGDLLGVQITTRTPYQPGVPFYVDRLILVVEDSTYAGPYFDGRTADTAELAYDWTGTADASTSTERTVQTHTIVVEQTNPDDGFDLSACVILRDPVSWVQDVTDVVTRVAVTWKVQGVDDEGNPTTTDATERVIDAALEERHGTRSVSLSSQLQSAADAEQVAEQILARTSSDGWRAEGLTIDDDDVSPTLDGVALVLDLLDGTSRIGAPIVLGDMPAWAPSGSAASVYLEGGTYRFVGGRWVLDLLVSASAGLGDSAQWDELDPAWTWDQWAPDISWNDLRGVAAP